MNPLNAGLLARFVLGEFVALPKLGVGRRFAEKKKFPMLLIVGIGVEEQDGLFLLDAGKIKEVRIGDVAEGSVRVRGHHIVCVQEGQRTRPKQVLQPLAVAAEDFWVD